MNEIVNILSEMDKLQFNDRKVSQLENQLLAELELLYGRDNHLYKEFYFLTQQGFWRPEKGDPRGSASCPRFYQKEYRAHLSRYRRLLAPINDKKQAVIHA